MQKQSSNFSFTDVKLISKPTAFDVSGNLSEWKNQDHAISALNIHQSKFRKKFKRVIDSSSDLQPFEREIAHSHNLLIAATIKYEAPYILCAVHSFLYRLTYF